MKVRRAKVITYGLIGITALYATALAYPSTIAIGIGVFMAVSGLAYNFYGKRTSLKFLYIATAHSLVFVIPYVSGGGGINPVAILSWAFIYIWVMYQISISGELKDMETEEENFIKSMGGSIKRNVVVIPFKIKAFAFSMSLFLFIVSVIVVGMTEGELLVQLATLLALVFLLSLRMKNENEVLKSTNFMRSKRLLGISIIEMTSLFMFIVMLNGIAGLLTTATMATLSVVWLVTFNKIEWGTAISPEV
jgi:4-hydroxybenzoate polyprenyltransferase